MLWTRVSVSFPGNERTWAGEVASTRVMSYRCLSSVWTSWANLDPAVCTVVFRRWSRSAAFTSHFTWRESCSLVVVIDVSVCCSCVTLTSNSSNILFFFFSFFSEGWQRWNDRGWRNGWSERGFRVPRRCNGLLLSSAPAHVSLWHEACSWAVLFPNHNNNSKSFALLSLQLSLSQLAATSRYPTISHSSSALLWQQSFPSLLHPSPLASAHQLSHVVRFPPPYAHTHTHTRRRENTQALR